MAAVMPIVNLALRTPLGALTAWSFQHLAPPPPETGSDVFRFVIQIEARGAAGDQRRVVRGFDPYALTAQIAAYGAAVLHDAGYARSGVMAPAQALDPGQFLQWLTSEAGVKVEASETAPPGRPR
jgi:hypothetical protein